MQVTRQKSFRIELSLEEITILYRLLCHTVVDMDIPRVSERLQVMRLDLWEKLEGYDDFESIYDPEQQELLISTDEGTTPVKFAGSTAIVHGA